MASLLDSFSDCGVITSIACDDDTHRRLVDMGMLGVKYRVKSRRSGAMLVCYGDFSAVTRNELAAEITVRESHS